MKRYLLPATPLAAMLLLTGCIDDNYDLSNINTTSEVKVDGLIIPVNVKDVTLNSVIDLDENSDVKKEIASPGSRFTSIPTAAISVPTLSASNHSKLRRRCSRHSLSR